VLPESQLMHKKVLSETPRNFLQTCGLTFQVIDFAGKFFCLPNGHFVETRIDHGLRCVK
jgi:hypothetical protein